MQKAVVFISTSSMMLYLYCIMHRHFYIAGILCVTPGALSPPPPAHIAPVVVQVVVVFADFVTCASSPDQKL